MSRLNHLVAIVALATAFNSVQAMNPTPNYRVELTKDTGGLDIVVRTFAGVAVGVGLENRSSRPARCSASVVSYRHKPSLDETRHATVEAGKYATLAYPARKFGEFSTAYINVKCVEKKSAN